MKVKTLFTMGWGWAVRYTLKRARFKLGFLWSKIIGRRYWVVAVGGTKVKLSFSTPYHERLGSFLHRGLHEKKLLEWWASEARDKRVVYDVGGFNGVYGIVAATINPAAVVHIFEPDPVNITHIEENVRLNGVRNCVVERKAVGDEDGFLLFAGDGSTGGRLSPQGTLRVPVVRLDSYEAPDLVKIDVEGGECAVLRGAQQALQRAPSMLLEVGPATPLAELKTLLLPLGYHLPEQVPPGNYISQKGTLVFAD